MSNTTFFKNQSEFNKFSLKENKLSYMDNKFFSDPEYLGYKAIEAFETDIRRNLIVWSVDKSTESIFYKTQKHMYVFKLVSEINPGTGKILKYIGCTRVSLTKEERFDTFMNIHSCDVGKEFLKNHPDKRVPLFDYEFSNF